MYNNHSHRVTTQLQFIIIIINIVLLKRLEQKLIWTDSVTFSTILASRDLGYTHKT
jgi:hypothetical protein